LFFENEPSCFFFCEVAPGKEEGKMRQGIYFKTRNSEGTEEFNMYSKGDKI
jgi:hypothetical protein